MGLDLTAYRKATLLQTFPTHEEATDWYEAELRYRNHAVPYLNPKFPHAAPNLVPNSVYRVEGTFGWRGGSYTGYNQWRDLLAKFAGYQKHATPGRPNRTGTGYDAGAWNADGGVLWELINFSDCEGTIAGDACKKIARELLEHRDRIAEQARNELGSPYGLSADTFMHKYDDFAKGFQLAADDGFVRFS